MSAQNNRRKNYFIKKGFQTRFILRFCGLVILGSLISGAMLFFYLASKRTVTTAFVNSRLSIISTADYVLPALIAISLITVVLISIATSIVVMYLSHRIAGPLYKLEKSIDEISAGNLALKIQLRSTDEISKMADCLNAMTENFRKRLSEIKAKTAAMDSQKKEDLKKALDYFRV